MRKKVIILMLSIILIMSSFTGMIVMGADESWSGEGVTINKTDKYTEVINSTKEEKTISYSGKIDFNKGTKIQVIFVKANDFLANKDSRLNDTNYIKFTVQNDNNQGVEVKAYALFLNGEAQVNKMVYDVTYFDGAKREYVESVETYVNVHATKHSFEIRKEQGFLYVSFDGLTAVPMAKYNGFDLSNSTLKIATKSAGDTSKYRIYPNSSEVKSYINDAEWATMGSTNITNNADGTTNYDIKDSRMKQYNGIQTRVREQVMNVKGYDITKPIVLEVEYDIVSTMSVWWAVGLACNPYENMSKITYYEKDTTIEGVLHEKGSVKTDISSSCLTSDNGVMFQTVTGNAQPQVEQGQIVPYVTRAGAGGYKSRSHLDTIIIDIGEKGTTWTYNGVVLFTNIGFKRSDIKGGIVYPYFHFIGTPANPNKENKIIIKGINAPKLMDNAEYKYVVNSNKDTEVKLENYNNVNGALKLYSDSEYANEIPAKDYVYNAESKTLTLKPSLFVASNEGKTNLYAKNNSGSEEITVLIINSDNVTLPPVVEKDNFFYKKGDATNDLVIKIDIKNGTFLKLTGSGIGSSKYTFTPGTDSTTGTLTISKDYLKGKDIGVLKFKVQTTNIYEEIFEDNFTVEVVYDLPGEGGGDEKPEPPKKKGCGAIAFMNGNGGNFIGGLMLAISAVAIVAVNKRRKTN